MLKQTTLKNCSDKALVQLNTLTTAPIRGWEILIFDLQLQIFSQKKCVGSLETLIEHSVTCVDMLASANQQTTNAVGRRKS